MEEQKTAVNEAVLRQVGQQSAADAISTEQVQRYVFLTLISTF
jgi:hypothetical protein